MEKINRELLIKEISSRLPYGVKAQVLGWDEEKGEVEVPLRVYSINTDGYVYFESNDYDVDYVAVDNCLLFLRPMSSMTEEEKKDILQSLNIHGDIDNEGNLLLGVECNIITLKVCKKYLEELNKRMFDVCHMIEKGLALETPKEMYK